jgi:hypothetical protein
MEAMLHPPVTHTAGHPVGTLRQFYRLNLIREIPMWTFLRAVLMLRGFPPIILYIMRIGTLPPVMTISPHTYSCVYGHHTVL